MQPYQLGTCSPSCSMRARWIVRFRCMRPRAACCSQGDNSSASTSSSSGGGSGGLAPASMAETLVSSIDDTNQLQTRLAAAITAEDYRLASLLRDRLTEASALTTRLAPLRCSVLPAQPRCSAPNLQTRTGLDLAPLGCANPGLIPSVVPRAPFPHCAADAQPRHSPPLPRTPLPLLASWFAAAWCDKGASPFPYCLGGALPRHSPPFTPPPAGGILRSWCDKGESSDAPPR